MGEVPYYAKRQAAVKVNFQPIELTYVRCSITLACEIACDLMADYLRLIALIIWPVLLLLIFVY